MKINITVPKSTRSPECGLIALFTRYSLSCGASIALGDIDCFCPCDDHLVDPRMQFPLTKALIRAREQREFSEWCGADIHALTGFLAPNTVAMVEEWSALLPSSGLYSAGFGDIEPLKIYRDSLRALFGRDLVDLSNPIHAQTVRSLACGAVQLMLAAQCWLESTTPDYLVLSDGADWRTRALQSAADLCEIPVLLFQWNLKERVVQISHSRTGKAYSSQFVIEDFAKFRGEVLSWPSDLLKLTQEILDTFGIGLEAESARAAG